MVFGIGFFYKKELLENSLEVNFYNKINEKFMNGDYLFVLTQDYLLKLKQFID